MKCRNYTVVATITASEQIRPTSMLKYWLCNMYRMWNDLLIYTEAVRGVWWRGSRIRGSACSRG